MFHRRLLLLLTGFVVATVVLAGQLYRLTVVQGAMHRTAAEEVLSTRQLIDTVRGRILDRKGRVLAEDRPCYDVLVDYQVITGEWAYALARRNAYRDYRDAWSRMGFDQREKLIAQYRKPYDQQVEELWNLLSRLGGIDREGIEARKADIVERVQMIRADVWGRRAQARAEQGEPAELKDVVMLIAEEREMHTILANVDDDVAFALRELADELPPVRVEPAKKRAYATESVQVELDLSTRPLNMKEQGTTTVAVNDVIGHLVGSMRDVYAEDLDEVNGGRPFRHADGTIDLGGYLPGDRIGAAGIEAAAESLLRGRRGQVHRRRDTQEETRQPARPGKDVHVTLDFNLQARIAAAMDPAFGLTRVQSWHRNEDTPVGTPLYGAAVVLEVDSGEILAMVSTPVPDSTKSYKELLLDPDQPLVNKPLSAIYPPGSTLKPLVYCIAAKSHAVGVDQVIECKGHFLDHNDKVMRCWLYRPAQGAYYTHGPLGPAEAIARSCNIYFYTCGHNLRADALVAALRRWGFGSTTSIGLPQESPGILPSLTGRNPKGRELSLPNAIMMGIGQGPIAVTPLQVAAAHAALARGGYYVGPTLIQELSERRTEHDLALPPKVVANAMRGMWESANADHGTGGHLSFEGSAREPIFNLDGVVVRGKTGTAQAAPQYEMRREGDRLVPNRDKIVRAGTHSWYVAHVQREDSQRPGYVVVVLIEYGGSGGRVSGPVANQILHAMRAEGYL